MLWVELAARECFKCSTILGFIITCMGPFICHRFNITTSQTTIWICTIPELDNIQQHTIFPNFIDTISYSITLYFKIVFHKCDFTNLENIVSLEFWDVSMRLYYQGMGRTQKTIKKKASFPSLLHLLLYVTSLIT